MRMIWLLALIAFAIILSALFFLPSRIRLQAQLSGAFVRGEARVGLIYGLLGVTLCFSAYRGAAGRFEARVWRRGHPEKIYALPLPKELLGVIRKELGKRRIRKAAEQREVPKEKPRKRPKAKPKANSKFRSRFLRALIRSARVQNMRLSGTFGVGNAAATALAIGAAAGALRALFAPVMKAPPSISVEPDFSRSVLSLELACIVNLSHGKSTLESI